jgi:hypothetical protein
LKLNVVGLKLNQYFAKIEECSALYASVWNSEDRKIYLIVVSGDPADFFSRTLNLAIVFSA